LCRNRAYATQARFSHPQQECPMSRRPKEVVLFDTEFTAWPGSMARGWTGPGEYKEVVQIGAVAIDASSFEERASFQVLIKPVKNPVLSNYFEGLTRITNARLAREGVDFETGVGRFLDFAKERPLFSYGRDDIIIAGNAALLGCPGLWSGIAATNLKDWLLDVGVPLAGIFSGELAAHVGGKSQGLAHDALIDARSLAEAVRYLVAKGAPNLFLS
jgi:inhibitor of KinA sporulation pathway (predicted exonuclease)